MALLQRSLRYGNCQRGVSMFQFAIIVMVYGGFLVALFDRFNTAKALAEEQEVKWTVIAISTSLYSQSMSLMIRGKQAEIGLLLRNNPIVLLDRLPRNYIGEFCRMDIKKVEPGSWFYDKCDMNLVYLLRNRKLLAEGQSNVLKYKVKFRGLPKSIVRPQDALPRSEGVFLERVE